MYNYISDLLSEIGVNKYLSLITYILTFTAIILICIIIKIIVRFIIVKFMTKIYKSTKHNWDDILYKHKFFHKLSWVLVPIVISLFVGSLPDYNFILQKTAGIFAVIAFVLISSSLINSIDEIYRSYEISKSRPIKSLLQIIKVVLYIIGIIILIAILIGQNPIVLLGGIGAMTAVVSLIFKDAILGFVAGIQLTANDMIRIGDWVEMPKYSADGTVIELSLTTVKVRNFDNTITSIPAYTMVSDSFINWRGMELTGGRRIKRALYINTADIKFCNDSMIEKFGKIDLLKNYLGQKIQDINSHNTQLSADLDEPVNGRRLTNLGTFRAYIFEYLNNHPGIHKGMLIMVRQLKSEGEGVPLEIYAFTNTTKWTEYEKIQADIFDHLYAVAPEFELSLFQKPSGSDFRYLNK